MQAYKMTFIVTTIGVVSSLTVTTLFAYGLSKKTLPGRSIFAFMVFFSMLFNGGGSFLSDVDTNISYQGYYLCVAAS